MNRCLISLFKPRPKKSRFASTVFIPLVAVFLLQTAFLESPGKRIQGCLFILNGNDLMCVHCMESFIQFCRYIQAVLEKNQIIGILIYDKELDKKDKRFLCITQKKLLGLMNSNQIEVKVLIDYHHVFNAFAGNGTTIILFLSGSPYIKKYILPLNEAQWIEVKKMCKTAYFMK